MDGWISNVWSICSMKHYSAFKKREILMSATTKMNLEGMRMSEKLHTEKDEHSKISLT